MNNRALPITNSYLFFAEMVIVLCIYEVFFTNHILVKTLLMTIKFGFLLFSLYVFNIDISNIVYISVLQAIFIYIIFKGEYWHYSIKKNGLLCLATIVFAVFAYLWFALQSINTFLFTALWLFALICIFIDYSNTFDNHFPYSLNIPIYQKAIRFFQHIKKPDSFTVLLPLLFLALYKNIYLLIRAGFVVLFLISFLSAIKFRFFRQTNRKISVEFSNYIFPIIYLIIACLLYYLLTKTIDKSIYNTITNNAFTVISGIALFNLGALFVLLQKNYEKFGSTVLVRMLLKTPQLIITTVIPFVLLIFNDLFLGSKLEINNLPIILVLVSILSAIYLFYLFQFVLETNEMLKKVFLSITDDSFKNYRKNIINDSETRIDAILHIALNIIRNNDITRAHSFFHALAYWININIEQIAYRTIYRPERQKNKFPDFFNAVHHKLVISENNMLNQYYIFAIKAHISININYDNYHTYEIFYESLFKYLRAALNNKNDDLALDIYHAIYYQASHIFIKLTKLEVDTSSPHSSDNWYSKENEDIRFFNKLFAGDHLRNIIDTAIENKCTQFLSRIHIFSDIFTFYSETDDAYSHWDKKVVTLYIKNKFYITNKNKYLLDNAQFFFGIEHDYKIFLPYQEYSRSWTKYACYDKLKQFVFNDFEALYLYAINIDRQFNDSDFMILVMPIFSCIEKNDHECFTLYYSFLTYIFDKIFEVQYKKDKPNLNVIYSLFSRIIQIKNYRNNANFLDEIMYKYDFLVKKYPPLKDIENVSPKFESIEQIDLLNRYNITKEQNP
jgi:hypothetical protein